MVDETSQIIQINDDFYRDSFGRVVFIMISFVVALVIMLLVSFSIHNMKPTPVSFAVDQEWRVQGSVPVDQPYLADTDVLQWVSDVIPKSFTFDFKGYNQQLAALKSYFTDAGWTVLGNQLNIYANYTNVSKDKLFITASPARAPTIFNKGLDQDGQYTWVVGVPIEMVSIAQKSKNVQTLVLKIWVVRVPTLTNLNGVAISNLIVENASENQQVPGSP